MAKKVLKDAEKAKPNETPEQHLKRLLKAFGHDADKVIAAVKGAKQK